MLPGFFPSWGQVLGLESPSEQHVSSAVQKPAPWGIFTTIINNSNSGSSMSRPRFTFYRMIWNKVSTVILGTGVFVVRHSS